MSSSVVVPTALAGAGRAHILFILDRSGSMAGSEADVIGGFNTLIGTLRAEPGLPPCDVSVTRFDTEIETFWRELPLAKVPAMTPRHFVPRGSTALLDAVGITLSTIESIAEDRYLCVIHTDGHENASREWTAERVKDLIARLEALGNWSFAFFGADTDAWETAARDYGVAMSAAAPIGKKEQRAHYAAEARVLALMQRRSARSSRGMGSAVRAVMDNPELSEEQIEELLDQR